MSGGCRFSHATLYPRRKAFYTPHALSCPHAHIYRQTHCWETAFVWLPTLAQTLNRLIYKVKGFLRTSVSLFALHVSREAFIQSAAALCEFTLGEPCLAFNSQLCRVFLSFFLFYFFADLLLMTDSLAPSWPGVSKVYECSLFLQSRASV